ncbi:MAG: Fe-S-containing hydro-lyase [Candidatus Omnitrophica bacterium]|nr:Fe-S-containing hydro-lyase [Candidatus Omnitrophota bacterium]
MKTPLSEDDVRTLHAGDTVLLSGFLYTARDAAHKRLIEHMDKGEDLPFDVKGHVVYYVGPTPAKQGKVIGSAGPTTSYRMDAYTPQLIAKGLKGMIGKGSRSHNVVESLKKNTAVYFVAVGGAGALIARCIKKVDIVAYPDLGPEAIRRIEVDEFPVIVANDCYGGNLF